MLSKSIAFIYFLHIHICLSRKYSNYTLFRGVPVTTKQLEFFRNLSDVYEVNFWREPGLVYKPVEFVMDPEKRDQFLNEAKLQGIYLSTLMDDVQRAFDKQTVKSYIRRNMNSFDWRSYFRLGDIYSWLRDLKALYPLEMQLLSIGKTYEDRDILAVKIRLRSEKREELNKRTKVFIEGGIHSREWISIAFVTYLIDQVIHAPTSKDDHWKAVAENYEWYIVPVLNPDGYEYSHTKDRLWRKNIHGVDLNRNFGYGFGTIGVSRNVRSDIYCGKYAFSEPESLAMANFVKANSDGLEYYLGFHSYGQYMIIPYAHSSQHVENFGIVNKMATIAAKAITKKRGTKYSVGTAFDTVGYRTSGVSGCWVKKSFGVPYVITFELPDEGRYGFALPPKHILPVCQEMMDGMTSLLSPNHKKNVYFIFDNDGQSRRLLDYVTIIWNLLLFIVMYY